MQIGNYTIANEEKLNRAIFGTVGRAGQLTGGVGENASDEAKLAEYDRLGGLVLKGKYKVKTGSFYDFERKRPRTQPEVFLVFRDLEGVEVEVPEGADIPLEVEAAEIATAKKAKKVKRKKVVDEE